MRDSHWWIALAGSAVLGAALASGAAQAQVYGDSDEYFESDNWAEDRYGLYDQDFDWTTDDGWYDDWNDSDLTAWNDTGEAQWDVLGYDDADEWGLFDW